MYNLIYIKLWEESSQFNKRERWKINLRNAYLRAFKKRGIKR